VDDEPDLEILIRQRFRKQIREDVMRFEFAQNGVQALLKLDEHQDISVVLSDINMPEMDGLTLLEKIGERNEPCLKSVIVSAYGDMENIRTAMNRGAFDFLTKPINFVDLETTISRTLQQLEVLRQATRDREQLLWVKNDLNTAARIQQSILPQTFPPFPNRTEFDIYAQMVPAKEVGGDFYDFFFIDPTHLCFLIADVSGKGVPAALYMMVAKTLLKSEGQRLGEPSRILSCVNTILAEDNDSCMFATVFCGILDTETGEVCFANAGHNPPLVMDVAGVRYLAPQAGFVLGPMEDIVYTTERLVMQPGDTLFLYTDGVTEASNHADELYGEPRLLDALQKAPREDLVALVHTIRADVASHAAGAPQSDDVTMVAITWRGKES
jgi:sigma-B regulation protein RsbU (phosphoserine phosphatase)